MWMTGFDAPSVSSIYLDRPMRNHTLMQTIARANRVFPGKHSGVIVDYANVFASLEKALAIYGGGKSGANPVKDNAELVDALREESEAAGRSKETGNVRPEGRLPQLAIHQKSELGGDRGRIHPDPRSQHQGKQPQRAHNNSQSQHPNLPDRFPIRGAYARPARLDNALQGDFEWRLNTTSTGPSALPTPT
jgi:hypothetical protein